MHVCNYTSFPLLLIFVCLEPHIIRHKMHIYVLETTHNEADHHVFNASSSV